MRRWAAVLGLVLSARAARADDLTDAQQHIVELQYTEAANVLESMIRRGSSEAGRLARAYELLGTAAASSGEDAQAIWAYQRLLAIEPGFRLAEDVSPRLKRALDAAREQLAGDAVPRLQLRVPGEASRAPRPTSITLVVEGDGLGLVRGMRLYHRPGGGGPFSRVTVRGPPPLEAIVPALSTPRPGQTLEYWVAALDEYGNEIGQVGTAREPRSLAVRRAPQVGSARHRSAAAAGGGILSKWWFWTGALVVAAGITTGTILLMSEDADCEGGTACFSVGVQGPE